MEKTLQIWTANSYAQPYPSQLRGADAMQTSPASAMPTFVVPANDEKNCLATLARALALPMNEFRGRILLPDLLVHLHFQELEIAGSVAKILLHRALHVVRNFDVTNAENFHTYLQLRLAVYLHTQEEIYITKTRRFSVLRKFVMDGDNAWVWLKGDDADLVAMVTPQVVLGYDTARLAFPKLTEDDFYGTRIRMPRRRSRRMRRQMTHRHRKV